MSIFVGSNSIDEIFMTCCWAWQRRWLGLTYWSSHTSAVKFSDFSDNGSWILNFYSIPTIQLFILFMCGIFGVVQLNQDWTSMTMRDWKAHNNIPFLALYRLDFSSNSRTGTKHFLECYVMVGTCTSPQHALIPPTVFFPGLREMFPWSLGPWGLLWCGPLLTRVVLDFRRS